MLGGCGFALDHKASIRSDPKLKQQNTMKTRQLVQIITVSALLLSTAHLAVAKPPGVSFAGGDGSSLEKAIIVKATDEMSGVHAEHEYIRQHYPSSSEGAQSVRHAKDRVYDTIDITTADGKTKTIYFDITAYFGK